VSLIGFHASHEQFSPSELKDLVRKAEESGFNSAMSSDHFHPWSDNQGQSGFAWSWLGSAMEATRFPIGVITAPGWRYHPAVIAQGAATLSEMYPDRFWIAVGSGEAINENITGAAWPEKDERNARLLECVEIIRSLLAGETVNHRGRVTAVECKLYTLPERVPLLVGAAVTVETAAWVGSWADGLLTMGAEPDVLKGIFDAFREGGGSGKPIYLKDTFSWAKTDGEALAQAHDQWKANAAGGEISWILRTPAEFDHATRFVRPEDMYNCMAISSDFSRHVDRIHQYIEAGADQIVLHNVGRNQVEFIEAFEAHVLPQLRS
jgi:probable non-F420 flavinoid oxidoreductase